MESLAQVKLALDEGLITVRDYEMAKAAFLRAQQIRSGFEAGLLTAADADFVKKAFTSSLDHLYVSAPIVDLPQPAAVAHSPTPAPAPVPADLQVPALEVAAPACIETEPAVTVAPPTSPSPPTPPPTQAVPSSSPVAKPQTPPRRSPPTAAASLSFGRSVSGVLVAEECVAAFTSLKSKSAHRYIVFKVDQAAGMVVLDEAGEPNASYDTFVDALPEGDCRFAVYDYEYTNDDGCVFNKIVFVMWTPDCSPLKHKMLYASTKDFFRQHLSGVGMEMQVTESDEIEISQMHEKVRDTLTRK
mmetsp:Transcript_46130/g.86054  ORF Transcript_46130/g.86054 Transcript_46130/m.86054 type:complete len:301 (+) Transcript_46130:138-1040(+)